jgi:hypothetical protein
MLDAGCWMLDFAPACTGLGGEIGPSIQYPVSSIEHRSKSGRVLLSAIALLGALALPGAAGAQELEARAWANTPVGVNFIALAYAYSAGNVFFDSALPIEDADGRTSIIAARYVRSIGLFGKPGKVKAFVAVASGHWDGFIDGEFRTRDATGFADARIGFDLLVSGAPPLQPSEFATFRQGTIVGLSFDVVIPIGDYDPSKLINLGSNRWAFNPEVAVSQNLGGKWTLEAAGSVWFFTDNTNFADGLTLVQDELYVVKLHAVRTVRPGFWWALGVGYGEGGITRVNGVVRNTQQRNWRFGAFLAYALAPNQGLSVSLLSGVTQRVGADFDAVSVAYQYSWGGR